MATSCIRPGEAPSFAKISSSIRPGSRDGIRYGFMRSSILPAFDTRKRKGFRELFQKVMPERISASTDMPTAKVPAMSIRFLLPFVPIQRLNSYPSDGILCGSQELVNVFEDGRD
ncbi:MAG: hypothetical protein MN733_36900 [Nitrososphaera sp.]|nr:hypothetical protein [Nitrososphaera sp.]